MLAITPHFSKLLLASFVPSLKFSFVMHRLRWNTIATITVDSITDILEAKPGHLARNISYGGMYELYHKGTAASQILYFLCRR
jgi:hypothetical protein